MPAARYWRVSGIETYDLGELELSALHLYAGGASAADGATILLRGEGVNAGTVFQNDALGPSAVASGSSVVTSTARLKYGSSSLLFSGSNLFFGAAGDTTLAPGTLDFCIEAWVYDTATSQRRILMGNASSGGGGGTMSILIDTSNQMTCSVVIGGTSQPIPAFTVPSDTWYHIAFCRLGTSIYAYLNGVLKGSLSIGSVSVAAGTGRFAVGSAGDYNNTVGGAFGVVWLGNVDDFRYSIGTSRYSGNFTPPEAFSLTGTGDTDYAKVSVLLSADGANGSTSVIDSSGTPKAMTVFGTAAISTAQSKFGGASLRLNGDLGHVYCPNISDIRFASGDFTIEMHFRADAVAATQTLVCQRATSPSVTGWGVFLDASGVIFIQGTSGSPNYVQTPTATYTANTWHHLAVVRSGTTTTIYVNGVSKASGTIGLVDDTTSVFSIGYQRQTSQYPFNGYIDDLRITKGLARYTANFTPPTLAFPTSYSGANLSRADATATLTSTLAPIAGSLASLQDSDTSTVVSFNPNYPGFSIVWDLGVGGDKSILAVRVGSSANKSKFVAGLDLQYSTNGVIWFQQSRAGRFSWPGANTMTPEPGNTVVSPTTFDPANKSSLLTLSNGNTTITPNASGYSAARSVAGVSSGKYYLEMDRNDQRMMIGVSSATPTLNNYLGVDSNSIGLYNGQVYRNNAVVEDNGWANVTGPIGILVDADARTIKYMVGPNVTGAITIPWAGDIYLVAGNGTIVSYAGLTVTLNAGQSSFVNSVPPGVLSGFGALVSGGSSGFEDIKVTTRVIPTQVATSSSVGAFTTKDFAVRSEDTLHGGLGRVYGTVKEKNTPVNTPLRRRVHLMDQRSRLVVRETWSDAVTGEFEFRFVKEGIKWFVYSLDHEGHYVSTSADNQEAERMVLP